MPSKVEESLSPQARLELRAAKRKKNNSSAIVDKFAAYQNDPTAYAAAVLGIKWWSKQAEIAQSVIDNRLTAVYAGHAVGKTHGVAGLVQWHFDCFDPSITLTTAPTWSAIHDLLWGEIKAQRPSGSAGRLLDSMRLELGPMHYAKGHNAETASGFQGRHEARVLVILDEAMGVPKFIWDATNAMMTSPLCRTLVTGNPTETSGIYYEIRENPSWNVITISCLEHPNILAELAGLPAPYPKAVSLMWVQEMLKNHATQTSIITADSFEFPLGSGVWYDPDDIFRSRVLGLFPLQASQSLWSDAWITAATTTILAFSDSDSIELGVDVARFGDDKTVIFARRGPKVIYHNAWTKQDTMETVGRVTEALDELAEKSGFNPKKILVKVDDAGVGGGVVDRLKELGYNVIGINGGSAAADPEKYYNRRSEMWVTTAFRARDLKLDLSSLPTSTARALSSELRAMRYKIQSDKSLKVETKEEFKKRLGHSPDFADALNLAFARASKSGWAEYVRAQVELTEAEAATEPLEPQTTIEDEFFGVEVISIGA